MRASLLAAALLVAPLAARAQAVPTVPFQHGEIVFFARVSGGPDVTGRVAVSRAAYTGADLPAVVGTAVASVAAMRTGMGMRDGHLRNAMDADSFPDLRYEVVRIEPGAVRGDTVAVTFHGRLTMHGVTRDVPAPGTVVIAATRIAVAAAFDVRLPDYGITPPTRFLGSVRVQPDVRVDVRLTFGSEAGP